MISLFPNRQTLIAFTIGNLKFDIRWYAFLILVGALLAYFVSKNEFKKAKYTDTDFFDSLFIYSLWFGIIGARLWFCAFYNLDFYLANPSAIIRVWDGGLAIQGGIIFGVVFAYFYCKANKYPFMRMLDFLIPNVLLGQFTGRWGNFVNKECHGGEVAAEYFDGILSFLKNGMYINGHYYEPLFFYESTLCLLGWLIIHFGLKKNQNRRGDLVYAYLMWYGVIRFFIEGKRTDSLYLGNIRMAQLTSVLFVLIGVLGYFGVFSKLTNRNKPTLMFDFDGTLMDTRKSIEEAYLACFKKYSDVSKFTDEVKKEIIGPALRDLFPKYFPGIEYDEIYKTYRARQIEVTKDVVVPVKNAPEVLKKLHEEGYKIGIISTRTTEGIKELLDMHNLSEYVDDVCGLNEVKNLKPDPEGVINTVNKNKWNKDVVLIGDSLMDALCGKNYGAYTIGYISDESRRQELLDNSNVIIDDLNDLLTILASNITFTNTNL